MGGANPGHSLPVAPVIAHTGRAPPMRIELVRRPQQSVFYQLVSPFLALLLTLIAGGIIFALLGKNPFHGLYYYFIDPLTEVWSLHELTVKAGPLILIAVGLCVCYRSNNWNIGAEASSSPARSWRPPCRS